MRHFSFVRLLRGLAFLGAALMLFTAAPAFAQGNAPTPAPGSGESAIGVDRPDLLRKAYPNGLGVPLRPIPPQQQYRAQPQYQPQPQPQYQAQPQYRPQPRYEQPRQDYDRRRFEGGPRYAPPVYEPPVYAEPPRVRRYSRYQRANACQTNVGACELPGPMFVNKRCGCFFPRYGRVRGVTIFDEDQ